MGILGTITKLQRALVAVWGNLTHFFAPEKFQHWGMFWVFLLSCFMWWPGCSPTVRPAHSHINTDRTPRDVCGRTHTHTHTLIWCQTFAGKFLNLVDKLYFFIVLYYRQLFNGKFRHMHSWMVLYLVQCRQSGSAFCSTLSAWTGFGDLCVCSTLRSLENTTHTSVG